MKHTSTQTSNKIMDKLGEKHDDGAAALSWGRIAFPSSRISHHVASDRNAAKLIAPHSLACGRTRAGQGTPMCPPPRNVWRERMAGVPP